MKITFQKFLADQKKNMPGVYHEPGSPAYLTAVRIYNGLGMAFPDVFTDRVIWPSPDSVQHGNRQMSVRRQEDMPFEVVSRSAKTESEDRVSGESTPGKPDTTRPKKKVDA